MISTELFQKAAIRYANRYKLTTADAWPDIETHIAEMLEGLRYVDLVRPFVCDDRFKRSMSWSQLSIKYALPVTTVWRLATCCTGTYPSETGRDSDTLPHS